MRSPFQGLVFQGRGEIFADCERVVALAFGDGSGFVAEERWLVEMGPGRGDFGERVVELEVVPEDGGSLQIAVAAAGRDSGHAPPILRGGSE